MQVSKLYPLQQARQIITSDNNGFFYVKQASKHTPLPATSEAGKDMMTVLKEHKFVGVSATVFVVEGLMCVGLNFSNFSSENKVAYLDDIQLKDGSYFIVRRMAPELAMNRMIALYNSYASTPISAPAMEKRGYGYSSGYASGYGTANTYGTASNYGYGTTNYSGTTYSNANVYGSSTSSYYETESETAASSFSRSIQNTNKERLTSQAQSYINMMAASSFWGNMDIPPESNVFGYVYYPYQSFNYPLSLRIKYDDETYVFNYTDNEQIAKKQFMESKQITSTPKTSTTNEAKRSPTTETTYPGPSMTIDYGINYADNSASFGIGWAFKRSYVDNTKFMTTVGLAVSYPTSDYEDGHFNEYEIYSSGQALPDNWLFGYRLQYGLYNKNRFNENEWHISLSAGITYSSLYIAYHNMRGVVIGLTF